MEKSDTKFIKKIKWKFKIFDTNMPKKKDEFTNFCVKNPAFMHKKG